MRRVEHINESMFGYENSTVDPNRFYSILLDARAASVSENMCDIADKLLQGEKENAKGALEQLWQLKKNLFSGRNDTIDMLIEHYQDKLDILREREEHLKKVSVDSRNLLEEKRKRDEEIASIKQQVTDATRELDNLTDRLNKLKVKEQELTLIDHQLREELNRNENEIVNGLYEIILTQQEEAQNTDIDEPGDIELPPPPSISEVREQLQELTERKPATAIFEPPVILSMPDDLNGELPEVEKQSDEKPVEQGNTTTIPEVPSFPKSVVKTTKGKVIGEYFYDSKAYKNERHYILNTDFFAEELLNYTNYLKQKFELSIYTEMLWMIQDVMKRTSENKRLHFEVATNEILNEKTVKRLYHDSKLRSMDEVERFGVRLRAKIDALGNNYVTMLKEQMQRCTESA